jgi:hypothetical protein
MRIWAIAVLLAVAVAYARGGRLHRLAELPLPAILLAPVWAAAAVELSASHLPAERRFAVTLASYFVVGGVLAAYLVVLRRRGATFWMQAGVSVLALGWLVNLLPIVANGGMPVSRHALARAGLASIGNVKDGYLYKHVGLGTDTHLGALGDVLPIPLWPVGIVVSPGDLVLAAGFFLFVLAALRQPMQARLAADSTSSGSAIATR